MWVCEGELIHCPCDCTALEAVISDLDSIVQPGPFTGSCSPTTSSCSKLVGRGALGAEKTGKALTF